MSLIEWNDEIYSVGINKMDQEHKRLISMINALDKLKEQPNKDYLERVFVTLIEYTRDHFAHEERIMERMQYPRLAEHKKQHQIFVDMVTRFKSEYQSEHAHT